MLTLVLLACKLGSPDDTDGAAEDTDGVPLSDGETVEVPLSFALPVPPSMDVALVIDTSCAASDHVRLGFDVSARDAALGIADAHWGVATFVDYPVAPFGGAGQDLPFFLKAPLADDPGAADATLKSVPVLGGADAPEAGMEALFQALSGAGYDLGCDGTYDAIEDVAPFAPSAADPFGGTAPAAWPSVTSGALGGLGFRDGAVHVVLYATETHLRDADTDATPGGCHDAGRSDVLDAAAALDAWLVGGNTWEPSTGNDVVDQIEALARDAGSVADLDGDGVDEPLRLDLADWAASWTVDVDGALAAIAARSGADGLHEALTVEVEDPLGLVTLVDPTGFADLDARTTPSLDVRLTLTGIAVDEDARVEIPVRLLEGGTVIGEQRVVVRLR